MKTCPKCGSEFERRPNLFYWRGRFFHGLYCKPCNAAWDDPSDSFEAHVARPPDDADRKRAVATQFEDECMPNGTMGTGRGAALRRRPTINPQCGSQGLDDDGHCTRCGLIPITGERCPPGFLVDNGEMIVRAAIRYQDQVWSAPPPGRHHTVIQLMIEAGLPSEACGIPNQGFVTSTGRFVDRYEGYRIAQAAGQLWRKPTPDGMLTSEDVW